MCDWLQYDTKLYKPVPTSSENLKSKFQASKLVLLLPTK